MRVVGAALLLVDVWARPAPLIYPLPNVRDVDYQAQQASALHDGPCVQDDCVALCVAGNTRTFWVDRVLDSPEQRAGVSTLSLFGRKASCRFDGVEASELEGPS